jgi:small nuclear ribonucleoprotein (snRNP)-like protein
MSITPSVFHMLEKLIGRRLLVIIDKDFGYEGVMTAVSQHPPGLWMAEAEAVILRSSLANPLPQVASREKRSELFINLNSVLRIEVLHRQQ